MATYSAGQIIGKTLIARRSVALKRSADDKAKTIYTVPSGGTVGVVYSYVGGDASPLWWAFYDNKNQPYYAKHDQGLFDISTLKEQGALTVQEEQEKKEADEKGNSWLPDNPFKGFGESAGKYIGIGIAVLAGAMALNMLMRRQASVSGVRRRKRRARRK